MERPLLLAGGCAAALVLPAPACSTLNVTTPNGIFLYSIDQCPHAVKKE